jgi:hypothetical protein
MVKELEDEDCPRIRLVVEDPTPETPLTALEANLIYAASVAAHAIRLGCMVELVTADGSTEFGQGESHLDRILERLALYEAPAAPRPLAIPAEVGRVVHIRLDARRGAPGQKA